MFRTQWDALHIFFSRNYIRMAKPVLELLIHGPIHMNSQNIFLPGSQTMFVAHHCVGVAPMVIMTLVFLWNPLPKPRRMKYWVGAIATIVFLNWFRITTLGFMLYAEWKQFFYFSHSYTYILMIYGVLFVIMLSFFWTILYPQRQPINSRLCLTNQRFSFTSRRLLTNLHPLEREARFGIFHT